MLPYAEQEIDEVIRDYLNKYTLQNLWLIETLSSLTILSCTGNLALEVVNQFWRVFYQEMLPYAEQGFDEVIRGYLNKYTLQVPYDQMWIVD